jgi:hypothetical protein
MLIIKPAAPHADSAAVSAWLGGEKVGEHAHQQIAWHKKHGYSWI